MPFFHVDQSPSTLNDSHLIRHCKRTKRSYAHLCKDEVKLFTSHGRWRHRRDYEQLYKPLSKFSINIDTYLNDILDLKYAIIEDLPVETFKYFDDKHNLTPEGHDINIVNFIENSIRSISRNSESNPTNFDTKMSEVENNNSNINSNSENPTKNHENNSVTPENVETLNVPAQQTENMSLHDAPKEGVTRTPRPIVVEMPINLAETIKKTADNCNNNFYVKTTENWMKLFADSLEIKQKLIDCLNSKQFKFYVTLDTIPLLRLLSEASL